MPGSPRVLVVDRNVEFLQHIRWLLGLAELAADLAHSLEEAEQHLAIAPPDLLICGSLVHAEPYPGLVDRLTEAAAVQHIPVLVCSGNVRVVRQLQRQGPRPGREVLERPFHIDDFYAAIDRLERPRGWQVAAP